MANGNKTGKKKSRRLSAKLIRFEHEFSRQLATIAAGAVALIVALIWKDALSFFLDQNQDYIQYLLSIEEMWAVKLIIALIVTVIAILAIILIKKLSKPKK